MKPINRRSFIMGAAGAGLSVLAGPALSGCSSQPAPSLPHDEPAADANGNDPEDAPENAPAPETSEPETPEPETSAPQVFFTADISPEGLDKIWTALEAAVAGNVAVKLSTGEPGGRNFLQPSLIGGLVQKLGATIVECNTAYGGPRASAESHLRAAAEHGFTAIADVDIMDADGQMSIPVSGGRHLTEDIVGANLASYDYVVSLAHFKGHAMGGFGGALKNCSIGIASADGKRLIHSAGASTSSWGNPAQDDFLESMAEAAKAVSDYMGGRICYVNVMNRLSVDCDCDSHPAEPDMADIGILASFDPVALDRACVDLVYAAPDGASLVRRMESLNGPHILEHAEAIGLGSQTYALVDVD